MRALVLIPLLVLPACGDAFDELVRRDTSIQTFEYPLGTSETDALAFAASQGYTGCGAQKVWELLYVKCWGME